MSSKDPILYKKPRELSFQYINCPLHYYHRRVPPCGYPGPHVLSVRYLVDGVEFSEARFMEVYNVYVPGDVGHD